MDTAYFPAKRLAFCLAVVFVVALCTFSRLARADTAPATGFTDYDSANLTDVKNYTSHISSTLDNQPNYTGVLNDINSKLSSSGGATETTSQAQLNAINTSNNFQNSQKTQLETTNHDSSSVSLSSHVDLSALYKVFHSIATVSPTSDCKISGDLGLINLGELDLCHFSPPAPFAILGTVLGGVFAFGFAHVAVKRFLYVARRASL